MRRKGEKPVVKSWQDWGPKHPVANMIASGDPWFRAWCVQASIIPAKLAKLSGVEIGRINAIDMGDVVSRTELEAFAAVWGVDPAQVMASLPDPALLRE